MKECWRQQLQNCEEVEKECLKYFKGNPVWDKLLKGFREKYLSYNAFSGKVVLSRLSEEAIEELEGFFQKNYHGKKSVTITAAGFAKALEESRFSQILPERLLALYFHEEMEGKRLKDEKRMLQWEAEREEVLEKNRLLPAEKWLVEQKQGAISKEDMELGARMINDFPVWKEKQEYLAIYAASITGNPHAFDKGAAKNGLLRQVVAWYVNEEKLDEKSAGIFHSQEDQKFYMQAGILMDDISNYTMIFGIKAWKKDGTLHQGIEGFSKENDMVQLSLQVVAGLKKVSCPDNRLYIVENPSIYGMLFEKYREKIACMCMNGQPRLSSLLLLERLVPETTVFYAGDFDPEGLLIAQKIRQYYKGSCDYWEMTEEQYQKSMSDEILSERRIKMLEQITDPDLLPIVEKMKKFKKAGYQENIETPTPKQDA